MQPIRPLLGRQRRWRFPARRQAGFTLIELLVVIVLISSILAGGLYYSDIGGKKDQVSSLSVDLLFQRDLPQALMAAYINEGNTFTGFEKTDLEDAIEDRKPESVESWKESEVADAVKDDKVTFIVKFKKGEQATAFGKRLEKNADIVGVVGTGAAVKDVTVTYDF